MPERCRLGLVVARNLTVGLVIAGAALVVVGVVRIQRHGCKARRQGLLLSIALRRELQRIQRGLVEDAGCVRIGKVVVQAVVAALLFELSLRV